MKNPVDYSEYECPYSHLKKDCGHELKGPEGFENTYGVWCQCGFRGPVFYLDPTDLKLEKKGNEVKKDIVIPLTTNEVKITLLEKQNTKMRNAIERLIGWHELFVGKFGDSVEVKTVTVINDLRAILKREMNSGCK